MATPSPSTRVGGGRGFCGLTPLCATWHTECVPPLPVQCLIIPVTAVFGPTPPLHLVTFDQTNEGGLANAIRETIGGWFQVVGVPHGSVCIDDEGKIKDLAENIVATHLAHEAGLSVGDRIVGPAVAVGAVDSDGYDTSVSDALVEYLKSVGCQIEEG